MVRLYSKHIDNFPELAPLVHKFLVEADPEYKMQFLLDCSSLPTVILLKQSFGDQILDILFYLRNAP